MCLVHAKKFDRRELIKRRSSEARKGLFADGPDEGQHSFFWFRIEISDREDHKFGWWGMQCDDRRVD